MTEERRGKKGRNDRREETLRRRKEEVKEREKNSRTEVLIHCIVRDEVDGNHQLGILSPKEEIRTSPQILRL